MSGLRGKLTRENWPQVQVALDLVTLSDAMRIARESVVAGVGWLEAGTPLIKSEGMRAVRTLSRSFPRNTVVADMKTLDAGSIECELAFRSGAEVVSISGLADNSTVRESVKTTVRYDRLLMADLLMSPNPRKRARELENLGVNLVCIHTGIDTQKARHSRLRASQTVREITKSVRIPVAAAGGVTPDAVPGLVDDGVKLIIVGGWITGSTDPAKASHQIVAKLID